MKRFFKMLRGVFRVFQALKNLYNSIKSGLALLKLPLAGWAMIAVAAFVIYSIATDYEELRDALAGLRSYHTSTTAPAGATPEIQTSVTKEDPEWMRKYCGEQAAKLPAPPFTYKERKDEGLWVSIPPFYVSSRMPKNEKGYTVDSITCRYVYPYDQKEAWPSMGVEYNFDINYSNEFQKRVDEIHTLSMDTTWEKISPLSDEEGGRPFYVYSGFPLLFRRENTKLGTVEYASMDFAIDYWVKFTVYEKSQ